MAKEKLVTITSPVGENAGEKIKVTKEQAASIKGIFGEYKPPKDPETVGALKARIEELESASGSTEELEAAQARIEELEAAIRESDGIREEAKEILLDGSPVAFGDALLDGGGK